MNIRLSYHHNTAEFVTEPAHQERTALIFVFQEVSIQEVLKRLETDYTQYGIVTRRSRSQEIVASAAKSHTYSACLPATRGEGLRVVITIDKSVNPKMITKFSKPCL